MILCRAPMAAPSNLISPPLPTTWPRFSKPLQLAVMASGKGSNLEAIAASIQRGDLHAQIRVVVYNNPSAGVARRAENLDIPSVLLNHRDFATREALDQAIIETMQGHEAEWVIMAGWMRRVTEVLIQAYPRRLLNIHPSLLPSFPGVRAVEQALAKGVTVSGCTVHYAELQVDSGPIIMQAAVPVMPDDTPATLQARIQVQEHLIYPAAIALAAASEYSAEETAQQCSKSQT
jgi:phosphoribosylglycinamide formyltransferase-1